MKLVNEGLENQDSSETEKDRVEQDVDIGDLVDEKE